MPLHTKSTAIAISYQDKGRRLSHYAQSFSDSYGKSLEYPYLQMKVSETPESPLPSNSESSSLMSPETIDTTLYVEDIAGTTTNEGIFNTINILMGISILTLPYALHLTGIAVGVFLFVVYSLITNYTGKLLGKCMANTNLKTYSDIATAALGKYGTLVSFVFILELMAAGVALLILVEDCVFVFIKIDGKIVKCLAFLVVTPFLWSNSLKLLSYTSLIGIATFVYLLILLIADGLFYFEQPGSLHHPMPINIYPTDFWKVWMASGLIMASYAGHGCTPSVYVDLKEKKQFSYLLNASYAVVFSVYICVALCGYLMFGDKIQNEITINMSFISGYSKIANNMLLGLMILGPLTKYPLVVRPITTNLELMLKEYFPHSFIFWRNLCRTGTSILILVISLLFPSFDRVMSIVGSLFSFIVSVILPCIFALNLCRNSKAEKLLLMGLIAMSIPISILGTIAALK